MNMDTQTFRGRTIDEAKRAALAALGHDAIVLTTRRVRIPGLRGWFGGAHIEVAAAAAERSAATNESARLFAAGAYVKSSPRDSDVGALRAELKGELRAIQGIVNRSSSAAPALEQELATLRELVDSLATPELPKKGALAKMLETRGIEGKAAAALIRAAKEIEGPLSHEALRDLLADQIKVAAWPLASQTPMLIALVGPSGVGKTTTAAKLAARAREEDKTVTILTTDTMRVGALAQIDRFGELLDVDVIAVSTAPELAQAIAAAKTDWVIVDTAGREPRPNGPEAALALLGAGQRAATDRTRCVLLCMTASTRAADATRFANAYAKTAPTAIAITKLDETRMPAALLHASTASGLPISVLCAGQRVPEDISPATSAAILDHLAPAPRRRGAH
jgi:flagellar biosynthesis protein FlhF